MVILTSRPAATATFRLKATRIFECLGSERDEDDESNGIGVIKKMFSFSPTAIQRYLEDIQGFICGEREPRVCFAPKRKKFLPPKSKMFPPHKKKRKRNDSSVVLKM